MKLSIYEACRLKRLTLLFSIWSFGIALFYSAVCQPIFIWANSDILIAEGVFLLIWKTVLTVVNYAYYVVTLAFMLYFISRFTQKNCKGFFIVYLLSSVLMYTVSLLSAGFLNGFEDFAINDMLDILMYTGFDALQMGIAVLIAWWILHPLQERAVRAHFLALTKNPLAEPSMPQWLPFDSVWNLKNELMRSALFASMIPAAWSLIGRLYFDIFFWGMPANTADALWMAFYYISDLIMWLVGYLVIVLILNRIDAREDKKRKAYLASLHNKNPV